MAGFVMKVKLVEEASYDRKKGKNGDFAISNFKVQELDWKGGLVPGFYRMSAFGIAAEAMRGCPEGTEALVSGDIGGREYMKDGDAKVTMDWKVKVVQINEATRKAAAASKPAAEEISDPFADE